jgi:hypothetical protein
VFIGVDVVHGRVIELKLARTANDGGILPERPDSNVCWQGVGFYLEQKSKDGSTAGIVLRRKSEVRCGMVSRMALKRRRYRFKLITSTRIETSLTYVALNNPVIALSDPRRVKTWTIYLEFELRCRIHRKSATSDKR